MNLGLVVNWKIDIVSVWCGNIVRASRQNYASSSLSIELWYREYLDNWDFSSNGLGRASVMKPETMSRGKG